MKSNLKVMLPTVGVAALLVSPAMATSTSRHHNTIHHYTAPARGYLPGGPYGYTPPNQPTTGDSWCAIRRSWDACHDPRENPQL
jgi:hypothetical protein